MTALIRRLEPPARQQGMTVPGLLPGSSWVDAMKLAQNVAETYTFPTDGIGAKGNIFGISADGGPLYVNFFATAAVPTTEVTNGAAAVCLRTDLGAYVMIQAPASATSFSVITPAAAGAVVTIEVWN